MSRGVQRREIGMEAEVGIPGFDHQLDGAIALARGEAQKGVFIAGDFGEHLGEIPGVLRIRGAGAARFRH